MRAISFEVNGTELKLVDKQKIDDIIRGSNNYLKLKFNFDSEWYGYQRVISVSDLSEKEVIKQISDSYIVPGYVTSDSIIKIKLYGKKGEEMFCTNTYYLKQK